MSKAEVERFVKEINADASVHEEVRSLLGDVNALVGWANGKGYDFSADEYTSFVEEHKAQLKEEDLDKVAGGTDQMVTIQPSPIIGVKVATEVVVDASVQAEVTSAAAVV